jgi:hypothetical protein
VAREFLDIDPLTGVAEYVEWHPDGTFSITTEQDVEPVLDFCKELANSGISDGNFKGEGWLYAAIPPVVQAELFKRGINILDQNDTKRLIDEINRNYSHLKTTHRHHALRR